jgi:phosphatidylglycerol:prolipoprotein diacylglycerol transferase
VLPSLALLPRSAAELRAIAILAAIALGAAGFARGSRAEVRGAALFAAYLAGILVVGLIAHTTVGAAPFVVSPYAATLFVAVISSWALAVPRLRSIGLPPRLVFLVLLGCLVFGVVGSRLANALAEIAYAGATTDLSAELADRRAGLGVFGAFVLDALFLIALFRRHREHSLARMLDASASVIAFNIAFGRIGCLLAGCCYGAPTTPGLLAIPVAAFQPDSPAGIAYRHLPDASIWATQPMESAALLGIALACEAVWRAKGRLELREGTVIAAGAGAYGAIRAGLEVIRADSPRSVGGVLTVWQTLGIGLCLGAVAWATTPNRKRKRPGER